LASTVEEALGFLERLAFDLLITDLKLPEYPRFLEDCRQRFPAMRLILMVHQRSQVYQVIHLEQTEIVIKPLSLDEMARKIREAIHSKSGRDGPEDPGGHPLQAPPQGGGGNPALEAGRLSLLILP